MWKEVYEELLAPVLRKHLEVPSPVCQPRPGTPNITFEHATAIAMSAYLSGKRSVEGEP